MKVAINGFGRIGRTAAKIIIDSGEIELVAVNDLADSSSLAHLLKYDSNYGIWDRDVSAEDGTITVDGKHFLTISEKEPKNLPWEKLGVDVVLECTGRFTDEASARGHIEAGAKRVIVSAPGKEMPTVVLGINDDQLQDSLVVSNASCTTNCISPVVAVMEVSFGIQKAMMTTVHAYTADQNLQDGPHKDLRRARAAAENIVPTTTGAAKTTTEVIPSLKGKFDGLAIRVPVSTVSLSDITLLLEKATTVEEVNDAFIEASKTEQYKGILSVTKEELVSSDFKGNSASAIVDLGLTSVVDGDLVKIVAWYDNEFGYANRLVELAVKVCEQ